MVYICAFVALFFLGCLAGAVVMALAAAAPEKIMDQEDVDNDS